MGCRPNVILEGFQDGAFGRFPLRHLQNRLDHACEDLVLPQTALVEVIVDSGLVTGLPQAHDSVDTVDEWWAGSVWGRLAEIVLAALFPGLQARIAAGNGSGVRILVVRVGRGASAAYEEIKPTGQIGIGQVA